MDIKIPWRMIGTADDDEYAFVTFHDPDRELAWSTTTGNNGRPIKETTLYSDWFLREPKRADATAGGIWGNYVFFKREITPEGIVSYTWVKYKSEEDKTVPFKSWREFGNHYWHPVLKQVLFFEDRNFPLSTNGPDGGIIVAARLYDRIVYIPSVSEGTIFEHELFLSPSKFIIGQHRTPVPTAVSWDYHGSKGSFQECLHPRMIFPPLRSGFASFTTGGGTVDVGGSINGQVFPATNFEDREPYFLRDSQEETEAGWLRHRIRVKPPVPPDVILQ